MPLDIPTVTDPTDEYAEPTDQRRHTLIAVGPEYELAMDTSNGMTVDEGEAPSDTVTPGAEETDEPEQDVARMTAEASVKAAKPAPKIDPSTVDPETTYAGPTLATCAMSRKKI